MEVAVEVVLALEPEDATLPARVGRLQHGRQPDRLQRAPALCERAHGGERRLRHAVVRERASHHDLVAHPLGHARADRGQAEALGHRRDDGNGAVGGDGQRAVDRVPPGDLGHRVDVGEVDRLRDVGDLKPERVGVAVDGDDANALVARLHDRAPLVAPGADEEDGLHTGRCYLRLRGSAADRPAALPPRQQERDEVPARDLAAVALGQPCPDPAAHGSSRSRRAVVGGPAIWVQTLSVRRRREGCAAERLQLPAGRARIGNRAARRIAA